MPTNNQGKRNGAVIALVAVTMVVMLAMVAFAVDYGFLLKTKTDMQRAADAAALAAVQRLAPNEMGVQDLNATRTELRDYVSLNLAPIGGTAVQVPDADIQMGRYNPSTVYENVELLESGTLDAVRVTLRRDGAANPRVPLFFARALGMQDSSVTVSATAVLQKPSILRDGDGVLPFAVHIDLWDDLDVGENFYAYGDGKVEDEFGNEVPGNWGTCDIGPENNSTSELSEQIVDGLRQSDLDALYDDGRIPQDTHIDGSEPLSVQGDTGLSSGMKSAVQAVHGEQRLIPIYDYHNASSGNNLEFHVIAWGIVTVVDSRWQGAQNTYVELRRSQLYRGDLMPNPTSLNEPAAIEGAYSTPVLVQ